MDFGLFSINLNHTTPKTQSKPTFTNLICKFTRVRYYNKINPIRLNTSLFCMSLCHRNGLSLLRKLLFQSPTTHKLTHISIYKQTNPVTADHLWGFDNAHSAAHLYWDNAHNHEAPTRTTITSQSDRLPFFGHT